MSQEILNKSFRQLDDAITLCIENGLTIPSLILIYSSIDIAGRLNSEEPTKRVKDSFTKWVDRYMTPEKTLGCTAIELYGARCGVIHTLSSDSKESKKGIIRKVFYA